VRDESGRLSHLVTALLHSATIPTTTPTAGATTATAPPLHTLLTEAHAGAHALAASSLRVVAAVVGGIVRAGAAPVPSAEASDLSSSSSAVASAAAVRPARIASSIERLMEHLLSQHAQLLAPQAAAAPDGAALSAGAGGDGELRLLRVHLLADVLSHRVRASQAARLSGVAGDDVATPVTIPRVTLRCIIVRVGDGLGLDGGSRDGSAKSMGAPDDDAFRRLLSVLCEALPAMLPAYGDDAEGVDANEDEVVDDFDLGGATSATSSPGGPPSTRSVLSVTCLTAQALFALRQTIEPIAWCVRLTCVGARTPSLPTRAQRTSERSRAHKTAHLLFFVA
jgi:hypothetical protein